MIKQLIGSNRRLAAELNSDDEYSVFGIGATGEINTCPSQYYGEIRSILGKGWKFCPDEDVSMFACGLEDVAEILRQIEQIQD